MRLIMPELNTHVSSMHETKYLSLVPFVGVCFKSSAVLKCLHIPVNREDEMGRKR